MKALYSLALGAALLAAPCGYAASAVVDDAAWGRVLKTFVDRFGRVDFAGVASNPADLERYVRSIGQISPASEPRAFPTPDAVLAYHLNAYNALSMRAIIDEGIPRTLGGLRKFWFFGIKQHTIGGQRLSLYTYENDIIRGLNEPRVHFALNCMSVSCPRLPRVPFNADKLQLQLDAAAHHFLAESRNVRVDHDARVVWLSEIFDFFPEDFLRHAPSLLAYVNRYRDEPVPESYEVRFIDYDWTVNRQPARKPAGD